MLEIVQAFPDHRRQRWGEPIAPNAPTETDAEEGCADSGLGEKCAHGKSPPVEMDRRTTTPPSHLRYIQVLACTPFDATLSPFCCHLFSRGYPLVPEFSTDFPLAFDLARTKCCTEWATRIQVSRPSIFVFSVPRSGFHRPKLPFIPLSQQ